MRIQEFSELPGPWGLPFLGSIFDISGKQQGKVLADWADQYLRPFVSLSNRFPPIHRFARVIFCKYGFIFLR